MAIYQPRATEVKWQQRWKDSKLYTTDFSDESKPKYYNLVMFPYPSGDRLHIGHWYNFAPADSWGRYMRMKGYQVFEPQGYDSFGLPAENYAISHGVHPTISIRDNIERMTQQLTSIGTMYDWSKMVVTSDPEYYQWTQWVFLQLYRKNLAYRKNAPVNWCPSCQTVLANEQVVDGHCERCKHEVTKKNLTQWFFKIRDYAERLLNYDGLDWPEKTILMQKNWIGKSEGTEVIFDFCDENGKKSGKKVQVFTTRVDTLFGASYLVLAPEHELVTEVTLPEHLENVQEYIEKTQKETDIERSSTERPKTGVFTGAYVCNPVNGDVLPVWIADYVLVTYGTGAVMAVPAHDERDFDFAVKYELPITVVVSKEKVQDKDYENALEAIEECGPMTDDGILIHSGDFSGMSSEEARKKITAFLEKEKSGRLQTNYRLRDWLVSRQRYWGVPIPIVYCEKCGEVPVPEEALPIELPKDVDFTPKGDGKSPLATVESFVHVKCYQCGGPAQREVDTLDTFVDSSWYYLRYPSAKLTDRPFDQELNKKWIPVDMYIGGPEHACMHLLYARFIHKVLGDLGHVDSPEPFKRLVHQGMITKDGAKMSKSKGNVVSPDTFVEKYGSDVFRMFLMFMGPFTEGGDWSDQGITGISRFVERYFVLGTSRDVAKDAGQIDKILHKTLKKVSEDIEKFQFNTVIAKLMEMVNSLQKTGIHDEGKKMMALMIAPLAPHLAEEMWELLGEKSSVFEQKWPQYNEKLTQDDTITVVVQVNGKLRAQIEVSANATKEEVLTLAKKQTEKYLAEGKILKEIYVPGKLVNFVVG